MTLAFILFMLFWGFIVGGLARWAVPGPDPMPVWLTIAIGIAGSVIGGGVARVLFGFTGGFIFAFAGAVVLVIAYRKLVQKRPITGPDAHRPPR